MHNTPKQSSGGRGGRRAGAGRPQTARRVNLDAEHAALLRELVARWRARWPDAQYTAQQVVQQLIIAEARCERDDSSA